jgi:hypothetical protein
MQVIYDIDGMLRDANVMETHADELERHPRFGSDPEAQRFWLGATDIERVALLRRRVDTLRRTARELSSR